MSQIARLFLLACLSTTAMMAIAHEASRTTRNDLTPKDLARVEKVTRPADAFDAPERFERMSAGAATYTGIVNANVFSHPSANLEFRGEQDFLVGNGLFRKDWVSAPSSTRASDGLGPLFNSRSCQSCHIKDGRGHAPAAPGDPATSLLVRLSVPPDDAQQAAIAAGMLAAAPEPVYGHQLQDFAVAGLKAEGRVHIAYEDVPVTLSGGETVTLRRPELSVADPAYGALAPGTMLSARVAPPMIGLGLLQAVPEADILAREDADDADGDGISGRASWTGDGDGGKRLGRFGWKALEPTIRQQAAHAFSGDMGLSTSMSPRVWGDCTTAQEECRGMPDGVQSDLGDHEVPDDLLDLVDFYSRNLAVPERRDIDDPAVLAGKRVFYEAGCTGCHTPKYVTSRDADIPAHRFQLIWPYTDLLLHDMGDGLADDRPEGLASGREWRTPPLWGIGHTRTVNEEATFLHDGRARTLMEAILWHGGEAQAARDRIAAMDKADRDNLIRFLESL